jgi:putative ABC transport system permease protein
MVPGDEQKTVRFLKRKWNEINPGYPFEYFFYDDEFDKLYKAEIKLGLIFRYFTILTICIACMGLFGLSLFAVQRKMKEIGIRKVLGADVSNIIYLLTRNFMKPIFIGFCIAGPLLFFVMNKWLQGFAYRTTISPVIFIFSGVLALFVALITVSVQVVKAAMSNPVKVLKYE